MSDKTNSKQSVYWRMIFCPFLSALGLWFTVLPGLPAVGSSTAAFAQALVYDLDEINGDVRILGDERYDNVGAKGSIAIFDFNDNGINDLVTIRGIDGSVFGYFDFNFNQPITHLDTRTAKHDLYMPYNINADFVFDRVLSLDINNDGVNDLITASIYHYLGDGSPKVFVMYGSQMWKPGTTIDLSTESADLTLLYGHPESVDFGYSMARGDLNNDGIDDLIIGAPDAENPVGYFWGAVYVVYGSADFPPEAVIDFSETPADITFYGAGGDSGGNFGCGVACGDVNGDGIDDLVVGAISGDATDSRGRIYVFYGSVSFPPQHVVDLMYDEADITVVGPSYRSWLGRSVACGDFNGDGFDDFCGGGDRVLTPEGIRAGASYLLFGRPDYPSHTVIDLATQAADITCYGVLEESAFGYEINSGDLDNDGFTEWAITDVCSPDTPNFEGIVYILQGSDGFPANHVIDFSKQQPAVAVLGDDAEDYLSLCGEMTDADQDGVVDLILGAYNAARPGAERCGEAYIILSRGPVNDPPRLAAGPGPDGDNGVEVRLFDPRNTSSWWSDFVPYELTGYGVNVACGDLDGDGYDEVITGPGPGPGHPPLVAGFSPRGEMLFEYPAYGVPRYGVNVAAGDIDGDGVDEILTGAGPGAVYGPHVRGWKWQGGMSATPVAGAGFLAYGTHRWGVNVAAGDIDGDGIYEIVTGAGPGAVFGPHVRGWHFDGAGTLPLQAVSFFAYGTLKWGVNVACGDIDGDGIDEILTGAGPGEVFGSHVRAFDYDGAAVAAIPGVSYFAYPSLPHGFGAVVACGDVDNDRVAEIITAPGPCLEYPAWIKTWNYDGDELVLLDSMSFMAFDKAEFGAGARPAFGNFFQEPLYRP